MSARNRREELQSTTAVIVNNKEFSNRIIQTPLEAVRYIPGISLVGYNEGGVPWEVKIRGFTGGHFSGVSFTLDGVQLNGPNGNFDANFIMPLEIETVEVVKGPSSVYFGLNAMGGSVAYSSIKEGDFTRLQLRYGSYGDAQAAGILAKKAGNFDHVYAFQVNHAEGWRDNSAGNKKNVSAQWQYHPTDRLALGLNVRAYQHHWDQAGFLWSRENVSPRTAYNDDNGGEASRQFVRLSAAYQLSEDSELNFQGYFTKLDFTRYQRAYRNLLWTNGNENNTQSRNMGLRAAYSYRGVIGGRELAAALGVEWRQEKQELVEWNFLPGEGKTRGAVNRSWNNDVDALSLFGEVNYQILEPLWVRLGLRYDSYGGDRSSLAPALLDNVKAKRRDALNPKIGLLYAPLTNLEFFANYGQTKDLPSLSGGEFFTKPEEEMPKSRQFEVGVKAAPVDGLSLGLAGFHIDTKNDLSTNVALGRLENIGQTKRFGLEFSASADWADYWRADANYTWQKAVYKNTVRRMAISLPNNARSNLNYDVDGRRLDDTPKHIVNARLSYEPPRGLGGRISFWWYGDMVRNDLPLDVLNSIGRPDYRLEKPDTASLDLRLDWRFNETYRLSLDVMNVLDRRNIGFAAPTAMADTGYVYSLQPPRTFYLGLEADWR
ncbi:MAG: TonB-dependent receptor [Deltaproteobacteria bacterium]|nr:TonB-dependent receptor [Deltaproteobacteria bacterium]